MWPRRRNSRSRKISTTCTGSATDTRKCAVTLPSSLRSCRSRAAPAARDSLDAVEMLKNLNADNAQGAEQCPGGFVKKRWEDLVFTEAGVDRRFYELCVLCELKNALRYGDIWVQGSRQFKDFDEYLLPAERFVALQQAGQLPLAVITDCERYLHNRLQALKLQLEAVTRMAALNKLPDATITEAGLKLAAASPPPKGGK